MKRALVPFAFLVAACGAEPPPAAPMPAAPPPPPPTASAPAAPAPSPGGLAYPAARRDDQVDDLHGVKVPDPYRWLEDGKSDEVKKGVDDEDALARGYLGKLPGRDEMAARFKELFYIEAVGTPRHVASRWFLPRRDAGKE